MRSFVFRSLIGLLFLPALAACSDDDGTADDGGPTDELDVPDVAEDDGADVPETTSCTPDEVRCLDGAAHVCNAAGDGWASVTECAGTTPLCLEGLGCAACAPGTAECVDAATARTCAADGSAWLTEPCDETLGETCVGEGLCTDLSAACLEAQATYSNEACEFWATQTSNAQLVAGAEATILFGLEFANHGSGVAHVQVQGASGVMGEATIPPGGTAVVTLPWDEALRAPTGSAIVRGAAYRIRSDLPIAAAQFNPLEFFGGSPAYTADASLLLPAHTLTGNYMIASRPAFMMRQGPAGPTATYLGMPGFLAVVATADDTQVELTFSAETAAGTVATGVLEPYGPGDTATFMLDRFDVLQILTRLPPSCTPTVEDPSTSNGYCDLGPTYDLTGTLVTADRPVAVFGGHDCSFVPFDRMACDHLEDQLPPLEAWGTEYVGVRNRPLEDEPTVWRVISREDGNRIRFRPDIWTPALLDRGEYFELETTENVSFAADAPFLAVQFLVGQGENTEAVGDPSMVVLPPVAQFRTEYGFFAPEVYYDDATTSRRGESWLNLVATSDAPVLLDDAAVSGFTPLGTLDRYGAQVRVTGGAHRLSSTAPFGVMVHGYGNYVSYALPGGMNVAPISPLP